MSGPLVSAGDSLLDGLMELTQDSLSLKMIGGAVSMFRNDL